MKAWFLIWITRRMWIANRKQNWNKHKWCKTKLGSRTQKCLALYQEMNNMLFLIICGNQVVNNILHIRVHPSLFYPPPYDNLFDNVTNGIISLLPIRLDPFHPFMCSTTCWTNLKFNPTQFMDACLLELFYVETTSVATMCQAW